MYIVPSIQKIWQHLQSGIEKLRQPSSLKQLHSSRGKKRLCIYFNHKMDINLKMEVQGTTG